MDFDSPFRDQLNTNYCPSDREINDIKSLIVAKQAIVEDIDRQMKELDARRAGYAKFITEHSPLLSPIRRIPPDVLCSIFSACLPPLSSTYMNRQKVHAVVAITHVCRQWRNLAIAQPLLWTNFAIFHPVIVPPRLTVGTDSLTPAALAVYQADLSIYSKQLARIQEMLLAWISRSGSCPLTFTLKSQDVDAMAHRYPGSPPPSINETVVDILCAESFRWKSASFDLWIHTATSPLLRFSTLSPKDVPQLENIRHKIDFGPDMGWDDSRLLEGRMAGIGLFGGPSVRKLSIDRPSPSLESMSIDWTAITNIELYDSHYMLTRTRKSIQFITSVLKACPNLILFSARLNPGWQSQVGIDSDITLPLTARVFMPHLVSLSIENMVIPSGLASSLHLPSLRTLSLLCNRSHADEDSGFVEWITTFGDGLTEVTLLSSGLTESGLDCCLQHLPNVTTLRLLESPLPPRTWPEPEASTADGDLSPSSYVSVLQRLTTSTANGDEQRYCPKLQKFGFRMENATFSERDLLTFIAGRRSISLHPSCRLKTVIVKFSFRQLMNLREELQLQGVDMEDMRLIIKYRVHDRAISPFSNLFEELNELPITAEDRIIMTDIWVS